MKRESYFMNQLWVLLIAILTLSFYANLDTEIQACEIEMNDLSKSIQSAKQKKIITLSGLVDPNSEEPIRRYVQAFSDGSLIIIEQKHCMMYNLTVTLLLSENATLDTVPERLASTLNKTVVWNKWFNTLDVEKILRSEFKSNQIKRKIGRVGSISYNLNDKIKTTDENSESHLRLVKLEAGILPFNRIISVYIGVGGM
jgi:hypothetical protein